jgi:hypothetical protein
LIFLGLTTELALVQGPRPAPSALDAIQKEFIAARRPKVLVPSLPLSLPFLLVSLPCFNQWLEW